MLWENIDMQPKETVLGSKVVLVDSVPIRNITNHTLAGQNISQQVTWEKPTPGFLKCNVDAGFHA